MPTPVPAAPSAVPTAPDRTDRPTFAARATAMFVYVKDVMWGEITAYIANAYANAVSSAASAVAAALSETNALTSANTSTTNAQAAAASAGAAAWVSGTTYALGVAARSTVNQRIYIKITATAGGAVDPSANATDWKLLDLEMPVQVVSGTTQACASGYRYLLTNVAATACTAPAAVDQAEFCVIPANGLATNTVNFGAATVLGPNGQTLTGVMTLDVGPLRAKYFSTLTKWVVMV